MAKEITGTYTPGVTTLYAVLKIAGTMYNGSSFEAPLTANWGNYDLALTESDSTGHYYLDMPAGLDAGLYEFVLYNRAGGSPAPTDPRWGSGVIYWDGSQDVGTQLLLSRLGTPAGVSMSADIAAVKSETAEILTDTGTTLPATLGTIEGKIDTVDTVVDAILVDTDATIPATLVTIAGYIDTEVAAIKAKTDNLPASPAAVGDIPTTAAIADKVLGRNHEGGSDGGRTVARALGVAVNRYVRSGDTVTFYHADDTTPWWTVTLVTSTTAYPAITFTPD